MQTHWLEPTGELLLGLRRYTPSSTASGYTCSEGFHDALIYIGRATDNLFKMRLAPDVDLIPDDDSRWPTHCSCGYEFTEEDRWQEWTERIWRRTDTGEERLMRDKEHPEIPSIEPGATWNAAWMPDDWKVDGVYLIVKCPDGHIWAVDSRASNCGLPDDNVHKCWVRHGDPRDCHVTVDKDGDTCSAGAGSILTPNWHGFLRDGQLVEC